MLAIVDTDTGRRVREIPFPDLGEILNPTWSPDARSIAFSASTGGRSDLFVYDLTTNTRRQLTNDAFADLQPAWSAESAQLAFVTDRASTDLNTLHAGRLGLAVIDVVVRTNRRCCRRSSAARASTRNGRLAAVPCTSCPMRRASPTCMPSTWIPGACAG